MVRNSFARVRPETFHLYSECLDSCFTSTCSFPSHSLKGQTNHKPTSKHLLRLKRLDVYSLRRPDSIERALSANEHLQLGTYQHMVTFAARTNLTCKFFSIFPPPAYNHSSCRQPLLLQTIRSNWCSRFD